MIIESWENTFEVLINHLASLFHFIRFTLGGSNTDFAQVNHDLCLPVHSPVEIEQYWLINGISGHLSKHGGLKDQAIH